MTILSVPQDFLLKDVIAYPPHNTEDTLEYYAHKYFKEVSEVLTERIYIPIKWTSYQIKADFGNNKDMMNNLQDFCSKLSKDQKYFTVVQYDDGILVDIPNCLVFSAGGVGDIPIPLTTKPLPISSCKKEYLVNFCGRMETHEIRQEMKRELYKENYIFKEYLDSLAYSEIIEKSYFTLCPRGYGKTSFRLYEAMQLGSVPIYISDEHWLPYTELINWSEFCIILKPCDINIIPSITNDIIKNATYEKMRLKALEVYKDYFSFESMFKIIPYYLNKEEEYIL